MSNPIPCAQVRHFSREEIMQEVHHMFGDDVPDDVTSVEIKGTAENPYVEFQRGR